MAPHRSRKRTVSRHGPPPSSIAPSTTPEAAAEQQPEPSTSPTSSQARITAIHINKRKRRLELRETMLDAIKERSREAAAETFQELQFRQSMAEAADFMFRQRQLPRQLRCANTNEHYTRYATKFKQWCDEYYAGSGMTEHQRYQVTHDKVETYFIQHLMQCPKTKGPRKSDGTFGTLAPQTLTQHLNGLRDLWLYQKEVECTNNSEDPAPPGCSVREFIRIYTQEYIKDQDGPHFGREVSRRATQQPYTLAHHQILCRFLLEQYSTFQMRATSLRDRVVATWQWAAVLRCNTTLHADLARLSLEPLERNIEGVQPGNLLVLDVKGPDAIRHKAMFRHVDWELCPHGALAFWLFWRFEMSPEPFPNLTNTREGRIDCLQRRLVYDTSRKPKVSKKDEVKPLQEPGGPSAAMVASEELEETADDRLPTEEEVNKGQHLLPDVPDWGPSLAWLRDRVFEGSLYKPMCNSIRNAFSHCSIPGSKVLHAQRAGAVRHLENCGLDPQVIQRMRSGSTTNETVTSSDLLGRPVTAMRCLGGHSKERGRYYIARADAEPPKDLVDMVFPGLASFLNAEVIAAEPQIHGTTNFIQVLAYLRVVLLQDAALLRQRVPNHFLLGHPLFSTPEFEAFADHVLAVCNTEGRRDLAEPNPRSAVQRPAPNVLQGLTSVASRVGNEGASTREAVAEGSRTANNEHVRLQKTLDEGLAALLGQVRALQETVSRSQGQTMWLQLAGAVKEGITEMEGVLSSNSGNFDKNEVVLQVTNTLAAKLLQLQQTSSQLGMPLPRSEETAQDIRACGTESDTGMRAAAAATTDEGAADLRPCTQALVVGSGGSEGARGELAPLPFRMKRGLKTVLEVFQEWYIDEPSVESMETKWGNRWRIPQSDSEAEQCKKCDNAFFWERLKLIRRVEQDAEEIAKAAAAGSGQASVCATLQQKKQAAERLEIFRQQRGMSLKKLQLHCGAEHKVRKGS